MAIDTRDKRMSMVGLALAVRLVLPNPDGGFTTAGDRAQLTGQYAGTLSAPTIESTVIRAVTHLTPTVTVASLTPDVTVVDLTPDVTVELLSVPPTVTEIT